jgi:phosphoesterase RecJ-like protein
MIIDNIVEEIKNARDIVILTHEIPDGDAVGSSLAMYNSLKSLGKQVDLIMPDCPEMYNFLPGFNEMKEEGKQEPYDLAIALDSSDIKRLNGFSQYFERAKSKIVIDHHGSNTMFGDYNFVNPAAPACAQILVTLLEYLGVEIDKEIGTCIATGLITDTGGFKYQTVTSETFEFVAELKNRGVNISDVYRRVLQIMSRKRFEITKIALARLEFLEKNKIAFTYITRQEQDELELGIGDHEGIVEYGRDVEDVEVSIFLREQDDGSYRASFRSNDYVNVSDICLLLGGGGHPRAAGCTINLPLEQAKEKVISATKIHLR